MMEEEEVVVGDRERTERREEEGKRKRKEEEEEKGREKQRNGVIKRPKLENEELGVVRLRIEEEEKRRKEEEEEKKKEEEKKRKEEEEEKMRKESKEQSFKVCEFSSSFFLFFSFCFLGEEREGELKGKGRGALFFLIFFLIFIFFLNVKDGRTPLFIAAQNGDKQLVQILLEKGESNVDLPDQVLFFSFSFFFFLFFSFSFFYFFLIRKEGATPLSIAAENGDEQIVQLLLEKGKANVDLPNLVLLLIVSFSFFSFSFSIFLNVKYGTTPLLLLLNKDMNKLFKFYWKKENQMSIFQLMFFVDVFFFFFSVSHFSIFFLM